MQSTAIVFVLLAIVVVSYCQLEAPEKCCFDEDQFEGMYGGSVGYYQEGTPGLVRELTQFAADVSGQRIGTEGSYYYSSGLSLTIKTIQLFKKGKQFTIVNDVCTSQPLSQASAPKECIPDDATFVGHFIQGVDELNTVSWLVNSSAVGLRGTSFVSVSFKTCAPLGVSYDGVMDNQGKQLSVLVNGGYFNITKGISDPDRWFTVPSSCTPAVPKMKIKSEKMDIVETVVGALGRLTHRFF